MKNEELIDIEKRLIKVIAKVTEYDNIEFLMNNQGEMQKIMTSSLNLAKLLVAIETEFDLEIPDEDIDFKLFGSLEKVAQYLKIKLEEIRVSEGVQ